MESLPNRDRSIGLLTGIQSGIHLITTCRIPSVTTREELTARAAPAGTRRWPKEPSDRPFDLPAVPTEAFAGPDAGPRDARDEPALAQPDQVLDREVRLVRAEFDGSARPWSPAGPDGGYAADERFQGEAVVRVRARHGDGERDALGIGRHVRLAALLAAIDRVRPGRRSPFWRERRPRRRSPRSSPPRPGPRVRPAPPGAADATGGPRSIPRGGGLRAELRRQRGGQLPEFIRSQMLRWISTHDRHHAARLPLWLSCTR